MVRPDSIVLRVAAHGAIESLDALPKLFLGAAMRQALSADVRDRFGERCAAAVALRQAVVFQIGPSAADGSVDEIMIQPVLDDVGHQCRFLVCWTRDGGRTAGADRSWGDLDLERIEVRFRRRTDGDAVLVEAGPWWASPGGELLDLWLHHSAVSAVGLGHAVMQTLITDAVEAAVVAGGPAVRIFVPSGEILAGAVPVFHGALRSSGLEPSRIMVAIDVELACDADLLPVIVHLRTMGILIDVVGLDGLTATLQSLSATSNGVSVRPAPSHVHVGRWCSSITEALSSAA